jgi:hypothetical protein
MHPSSRAAVIAIVLIAAFPGAAAAHAQLLSSVPAADAAVTALPPSISLTFDDALTATSSFLVVDASGATVVTGAVDPATPVTMTAPTPDMPNGRYEVRWTAGTPDGHIERGTFAFTIALATEPPAAPTATALATVAPSANPSTLPTPTPTRDAASPAPSLADGGGSRSGGDVVLPIIAAAVVVAGGLAFFLRRRGTV